MKISKLKVELEPLVGRRLTYIEDSERQEVMAATLKVINGWRLVRVDTGRLVMPDGREYNVRLVFCDAAVMLEFRVALAAGDVHLVERRNGGRVEILFKRGHWVALGFMGG